MSTWKVTGQSSDFSSDLEDLVEALLNNATNWTETDPVRTDIKFGNDWWDGYGDYQIHVLRGRYERTPLNNDWRKYHYKHRIEIHVFCRANEENKPAQWGKMERQIEKIISQNKQSFTQGVTLGSVTAFEVPPDEDNLKMVWHSMMTIELWYFKVDTS